MSALLGPYSSPWAPSLNATTVTRYIDRDGFSVQRLRGWVGDRRMQDQAWIACDTVHKVWGLHCFTSVWSPGCESRIMVEQKYGEGMQIMACNLAEGDQDALKAAACEWVRLVVEDIAPMHCRDILGVGMQMMGCTVAEFEVWMNAQQLCDVHGVQREEAHC